MEAAPTPPRLVYVVNRLSWQWTDEWYAVQGDEPVRAWASRADAERERERLEAEEAANPNSLRYRGYTPHTPSHVPEPFYEVVAVEIGI